MTLWCNAVTRHFTNLGNTGSNPTQAKDVIRKVVPYIAKKLSHSNNLALAIEAKIINPKETNVHNDIFMQ